MEIDIITLDQKIQEKLRGEEEKIKKYKETINDLDNLLRKPDLDPSLRNRLEKTSENYTKMIDEFEKNQNYNFYLNDTTLILQKYKEILKKPIKISFVSANKPEENEDKQRLVWEFLKIAKKYSNVELCDEDIEKKEVCEMCQGKSLIISDNCLLCVNCGNESGSGMKLVSYKDMSRTNILQKYTYERRSHFRDCINQFQGKQNCKIPEIVFKDLEEQFNKHNLLVGDENTPKEVRYSKIKKDHILLFLKELRYDKQYENVNYIYSQLTGIKCRDISHLEDQLLIDFDTLVNLYIKRFKYEQKITRKSFMNIHYVFFQLLNKNKFHCKKEEFNILKTIDRKTFHDDVFKTLFEELGWNHVPFF
jgi:hypothetical protein